MGDFDPEELGLMVGLEIHQQLGREEDAKLFCNCPAQIYEAEPDLVVERELRAAAGETGTIDIAARAEQAKRKRHEYQAYENRTCLVELDEEPPHPVNMEAITTSIMVAKAMGSTIFPKVQFMRKTIVDGSAVSGFQRTGLLAIGGEIPGLDTPVRIQTIGVEEDSAKIVERHHTRDVFNLTRLGIPLIEIATAPDIATPQQAQVVAAQIGMILRSTRRVKRGLGTIRQDLNVSVRGGVRNEIKGAQDLKMIPTIIEYEARRQKALVTLATELKGEVSVSSVKDVSDAFAKSEVEFIQNSLKKGARAMGFAIDDFKGILGRELCPGYRVGSELADLAKSRGFGGIIHSDEDMSKYGITKENFAHHFNLDGDDSFIVLIGKSEAIEEIVHGLLVPRLNQFFKGVPQEVRKANEDGTSSYLRPVPGAARMYPETDVPIVTIDPTSIQPPKLLSEQITDIAKETGLSHDLAREILERDIPITAYKTKYDSLSYPLLSSALLEWPQDVESRVGPIENVREYIDPLLKLVHEGKIAGSTIKTILEKIAKNPSSLSPDDMGNVAQEYAQMSEQELEKIITDMVAKNPDVRPKALMGDIMKRVGGKADGKVVMQILQKVSE